MVRQPLTPEEHERGRRLATALREARGARSIVDVARAAGISAETLRKIESGRIPTPAFFTVVALADALDVPLAELAERSLIDPHAPRAARSASVRPRPPRAEVVELTSIRVPATEC